MEGGVIYPHATLTLRARPARADGDGRLAGGLRPATGAVPPERGTFIMSDDHAAHAISAYGSRLMQDAVDRSPRPRRHASFANAFVAQLNLHSEPRRILTRSLRACQRRTDIRSHRQQPAHGAEVPAASGPTHTSMIGKWHLSSNKPSISSKPTGLRLLEHPPRPGRVPQSGVHREQQGHEVRGLHHRHRRRPEIHGPSSRDVRRTSRSSS